jgi:hypothetical protein
MQTEHCKLRCVTSNVSFGDLYVFILLHMQKNFHHLGTFSFICRALCTCSYGGVVLTQIHLILM